MSGNLPEELNKRSDRAKLREQLAESKQREATLTLERDAALNANQYARNLVDRLLFLADRQSLQERLLEVLKIKPDALAERDRAIERKTAERCAVYLDTINSGAAYLFRLWFGLTKL